MKAPHVRMRMSVSLATLVIGLALVAIVPSADSSGVDVDEGGENGAAPSGCATVGVLGVRGSGEPFEGKTKGMGGTVHDAFEYYKKRVRTEALSVGESALRYPAPAVEMLLADRGKYFRGLDDGVDLFVSNVRFFASRCRTQRFVFIGYSQGAMVLHRSMWLLAKDGFEMSRIDGVVAIADGDRRKRPGIVQYGSAKNGQGVSWVVPRLAGDKYKPVQGVPAGLKRRFHSVCLDYDLVCDANMAHLTVPALGAAGVLNHFKYKSGKPAWPEVKRAVDSVATRTRSMQQPTPTPNPTPQCEQVEQHGRRYVPLVWREAGQHRMVLGQQRRRGTRNRNLRQAACSIPGGGPMADDRAWNTTHVWCENR